MNLVDISALTVADVLAIWSLASRPDISMTGTVGCSFEGKGIRTRTAFLQAFRELGLQFTELPNLLKSSERTCDLAGYLDSSYSMFVIREANHSRLAEFANVSCRPVINAMSAQGHPCEVLTDAFFINTEVKEVSGARVCLLGPTSPVGTLQTLVDPQASAPRFAIPEQLVNRDAAGRSGAVRG